MEKFRGYANGNSSYGESTHLVYDVGLKGGATLHRYNGNNNGSEQSAIFLGNREIWWHYRSKERQMIDDWNEYGYLAYEEVK